MKFCSIDKDMYERYGDAADELDALRPYGEFVNGKANATDEEKVALAKDSEVVIFGSAYLKNEIIAQLDRLKIVQFMGTGVANYVDIDYCRRRGIKVLNVEGYGSNAVAEFALGMIFASLRNIPLSDARMKSGRWSYEGLEGRELSGSVVGVVGTGRIGSLLAQKLHALGAKKILAFDKVQKQELIENFGVEYTTLETLFSSSDIVTIHLTYDEETDKMIGGALIDRMGPDSFLINTARAEIVDYAALEKALEAGRIRGAAVDVYYKEPVEDYSFCRHDNLISTTHLGFFTKNSKRNLLRCAVRSIIENI